MTRHRQLAATAEREPVDRGDDGLGTGLESAEYILPCTCARFAEYGRLARQLGDVGAGDECASGAGEYHAANCIVDADLIDGVTQFGDRRVIQGVEFVGAVDGESRDAICDFKRQEFEGHLDVFVDRFADVRRAGTLSLAAQIYVESFRLVRRRRDINGAEVDRS